MPLHGTIVKGTIVLDQPTSLAEGTRVEVAITPLPEGEAPEPTLLSLLDLAGTVNDLPSDMALNHDHYLHGHPKK